MIGDSIYRGNNPALVGGSPQQVHEQLWVADRVKRRRVRAAGATVFLIVGWKFASPWTGLFAGTLFLLVDMAVYLQRRVATSVWRMGLNGAVRTSRVLKVLEFSGFRVIPGRVVHGYGTFPHLIVGPGMVWLVENQVHDPDTDLAAVKGRLFVGKDSYAHVVTKLEKTASDVTEMLSGRLGSPVKASVIVAVHGGRPKDGRMTAGGVVLMRPWRIPAWVHRNVPDGGPAPSREAISRTVLELFGPSA